MVAVTTVAVVIFGVSLGVSSARLYRSREVSRLERQATLAVGALPTQGLRSGASIDMPAHPRRVQLALYDRRGLKAKGEGPRRADDVVAQALHGRVFDDHDGKWLAVAVPVHDEEVIVGAARAAVPWHSVSDATRRSWLLTGALGIAAIAVAGAVAVWQSSRLAMPVRAVTARAGTLGEGDFTSRIEPSGIGELDLAAEALNRTAARLGELLGRERAFASDVSHQLNTPLTSLRLALESALLTPGADDRAAIDEALSEVERLQNTVATLLALSRDQLDDEPCNPSLVGRTCAERFRANLATTSRTLRVELDSDLPDVRCSAVVLGEILTVLLDNAVVHGAGDVTVSGRSAGSGVVLDVADDGVGITGDPSSIFQRRSSDAAGHGIGLALARSLAQAHGVRLELTHAGPKPVFSVALPGAHANTANLTVREPFTD